MLGFEKDRPTHMHGTMQRGDWFGEAATSGWSAEDHSYSRQSTIAPLNGSVNHPAIDHG